jgi:hypothetical protein
MHVLAARKKQCQYLSPSVLEAVVVKICFRRGHIQSSQVQVLVISSVAFKVASLPGTISSENHLQ